MRMRGGYLPKIPGRPSSIVEELTLPPVLSLSLRRGALTYRPVVRDGEAVEFGQTLAEASPSRQRLCLPAPAAGRVALVGDTALRIEQPRAERTPHSVYQPERVSRVQTIQALCEGGVWPFFWSSRTDGVPSTDDDEIPQAVIVNAVIAEPFRARGKVVLRRSWSRIMQAIKFLPRLIADYGTIHVVLTAVRDPVARMMYADLAGYAWIRIRPVPLVYPVEHPRVLLRALYRGQSGKAAAFDKDAPVWVIDVQGLEAAGACLGEGLPLHQRVVVVGGSGHPHPRHLVARIGTRIESFARQAGDRPVQVLRGGIFTGEKSDPAQDAVQYDDDGFFFLPEVAGREFLSFLRPGFDRASYSRSFVSRLVGGSDRRISTSLRGERRPCISCGLCEDICPVRIMPQVLHRYIHRELYEEAEAAGLQACVECGLCSYVCPSKIDLVEQFVGTKTLLRAESES